MALTNHDIYQDTIAVKLGSDLVAELSYLTSLVEVSEDSPHAFESIEELIIYVMTAIADGNRRPGSWERQLLNALGLVTEHPEQHVYRDFYGRTNKRP